MHAMVFLWVTVRVYEPSYTTLHYTTPSPSYLPPSLSPSVRRKLSKRQRRPSFGVKVDVVCAVTPNIHKKRICERLLVSFCHHHHHHHEVYIFKYFMSRHLTQHSLVSLMSKWNTNSPMSSLSIFLCR